jgi:hypothetical protein
MRRTRLDSDSAIGRPSMAKRAIGFDVDQPLRQRARACRSQSAVEDQNAGHAIAILAEIGDDASRTALDQRVAQAGGIESRDQLFVCRRPFADFEPNARNDRAGRAENRCRTANPPASGRFR